MNDEHKFHDLLWKVRRSVRYYNRRQAFFNRCHVLVMTLSALSGSVGVVAIGSAMMASWPDSLKALPFALITVFIMIDVVVGFASKAALYGDLKRRFVYIERRMVALGDDPPEEEVRKLHMEVLDLEAEEPPVLHVLNVICHNELLRAEGREDKPHDISTVQRWLAPFCDWKEHTVK